MGRTGTTPAGSSNRTRYVNGFINGGFDYWQRGTNFVQTNGYTVDRWVHGFDTALTPAGWGFSTTQVTATNGELPTSTIGGAGGTQFYCRNFINSVGTAPGVNAYEGLFQRIEDVRTYAGKSITISFLARSTISNTKINVGPYQYFGSGGSAAVYCPGGQVTLTSSWARYSVKVTIPAVTSKTLGTGHYIQVGFYQLHGATDAAGFGLTAITPAGTGNIDFAQCMISEGDVSVPFRLHGEDLAQELMVCQRYYERHSDAIGLSYPQFISDFVQRNIAAPGTVSTAIWIRFRTMKRTAPTINIYIENTNTAPFTFTGVNYAGVDGWALTQSVTSGGFLDLHDWYADAEL